ncbi:helix-turn-helix domain-containing protein [Marinomonas spartinae]|uniref:helix-turn-helix domain-containing protein n=1 Tax=Marinomonas spartinae TaxID=1792290 RepID=UPI0018F273BD|nr:helix-turn-helix domain-containing protein [Marinomonas spartinae]MBJ7553453.1 AraC family transcriptional regulator [Marinomonas spartinae]
MSKHALVNRLAEIRSKQPWLVMSAAKNFYLSRSDNPAISHYYSFEVNDSNEQIFAIPDGCVDILFDCDSSHPTAEVFGTPMAAIDIELRSHHRYFGVRFASGVVPDFLQVSAEELIEHHYNFIEVIPESNQVFENIVKQENFTDQVALFKQFYNGQKTRQYSSLTVQAVKTICETKGSVRVEELEDLTGFSTRTIQRQFKADLGMSPKAFSRIIRCQSAVYNINHNDQVTFSDLACDLGFSDQPHFLREFKKLVNTTPMAYQNRVKEQSYLDRIRYV